MYNAHECKGPRIFPILIQDLFIPIARGDVSLNIVGLEDNCDSGALTNQKWSLKLESFE